MHYKSIQSLYRELAKSSLGNTVDHLWGNILPLYFKVQDGYGIMLQPREKILDITIRIVSNFRIVKNFGQPRKVFLGEDKRVSPEGFHQTWNAALQQLTKCMMIARDANQGASLTMYGIVTVGHYSRFYLLLPDEDEFCNLPDYDGSPLHFKKDENEIDAILRRLVKLTSYDDGESDGEGGEDQAGEDNDGEYQDGDQT